MVRRDCHDPLGESAAKSHYRKLQVLPASKFMLTKSTGFYILCAAWTTRNRCVGMDSNKKTDCWPLQQVEFYMRASVGRNRSILHTLSVTGFLSQ